MPSYPPASLTPKTAVTSRNVSPGLSEPGQLTTSISDVLSNAKHDLAKATGRLEKLHGKIADAEAQIVEWTRQVDALRMAIQRTYDEQVGYEALLPVALEKQRAAHQRVERLERSVVQFQSQVKLEDYLQELEKEEDVAKEENKRYWHEVGEPDTSPQTPDLIECDDFDDIAPDCVNTRVKSRPDRAPIVIHQSVQPDELEHLVAEGDKSFPPRRFPDSDAPSPHSQPPTPPPFSRSPSPPCIRSRTLTPSRPLTPELPQERSPPFSHCVVSPRPLAPNPVPFLPTRMELAKTWASPRPKPVPASPFKLEPIAPSPPMRFDEPKIPACPKARSSSPTSSAGSGSPRVVGRPLRGIVEESDWPSDMGRSPKGIVDDSDARFTPPEFRTPRRLPEYIPANVPTAPPSSGSVSQNGSPRTVQAELPRLLARTPEPVVWAPPPIAPSGSKKGKKNISGKKKSSAAVARSYSPVPIPVTTPEPEPEVLPVYEDETAY